MDSNIKINDGKLDIDYHLNLSKFDINVGMAILIGSISAFLTVMFKVIATNTSDNSPVVALYFNIVIVLISVYSMKGYGVLVAVISAGLFCLTLENFDITKMDLVNLLVNLFVNALQAIIIWFVLSKFKFSFMQKSKTTMIVSDRFKILLLILGIVYVIDSVTKFIDKSAESLNYLILIFIGIIILLYLIEGVVNWFINGYNKLFSDFEYLLLICFVPSCIAALINSVYSNFFVITTPINFAYPNFFAIADFINSVYPNFFVNGWLKNFILWMGSNFILLSTFGYVLLRMFSYGKTTEKQDSKTLIPVETSTIILRNFLQDLKTLIPVKIPILLYYASIILWNLLFFIMYTIGWLGSNKDTIVYIFPWLIGNLLFISNFVLSKNNEFDFYELKEKNGRFKWFENRAITVENNTTIVMQVVVIALPIITTITKNIGTNIITIFVLNISAAIASIALIWVPQNNIKFMSLLKTLKTILHLFSISLLLLSSIMIMADNFFGSPPRGY